MKAFDEPSPSDWDRWIARLLDGEEPSEAARAERQTCSAFRRQDPGRHGEALQLSREIRAGADRDLVRNKLRAVVEDTGHPQWAPAAKMLGQHSQMFDETQRVEITGDGGGPVQLEGRAVVGLADVVRLAGELGIGHLVGLDAGHPRPELAAASDVLPGTPAR